jgi:hypothetical protein
MDNDEKLSITEMRKRKFADQISMDVSTDGKGTLADSYFKEYSDNRSYEDVFEAAFSANSRPPSAQNISLT